MLPDKSIDMENLDAIKDSDTYVRDMLDFYEEGWDARGIDDKKQFEARVKANVINTVTYTNEVISKLIGINIHPKSAYIKLENPNSQSVIISVSIDDYMNKELLHIYKHTRGIEKSTKSEAYKVTFVITYDDGSLNNECLSSEGYFRTHNKVN